MAQGTIGPGWYADPANATQVRWWDGASWSQETRPRTLPAGAPLAAPEAPRAARPEVGSDHVRETAPDAAGSASPGRGRARRRPLLIAASVIAVMGIAAIAVVVVAPGPITVTDRQLLSAATVDGLIYSISPDGSHILYGDDPEAPFGERICLRAVDEHEAIRCEAFPDDERPLDGTSVTWSRDGSSVAFAPQVLRAIEFAGGGVHLWSIDGSPVRTLVEGASMPAVSPRSYTIPSLSPDGSVVATVRDQWVDGEMEHPVIVLVDVGTAQEHVLAEAPVGTSHLTWSPDGTTLWASTYWDIHVPVDQLPDRTVHAFDLATDERRSFDTFEVRDGVRADAGRVMQVSDDGRVALLLHSAQYDLDQRPYLTVMDVDGRRAPVLPLNVELGPDLQHHGPSVGRLSSDGQQVLVVSFSDSVRSESDPWPRLQLRAVDVGAALDGDVEVEVLAEDLGGDLGVDRPVPLTYSWPTFAVPVAPAHGGTVVVPLQSLGDDTMGGGTGPDYLARLELDRNLFRSEAPADTAALVADDRADAEDNTPAAEEHIDEQHGSGEDGAPAAPAERDPEGADLSIVLCSGLVCPELGEVELHELGAMLDADPEVEHVAFQSQQEAYRRFTELFEDQPDVLDSVDPSTLPALYRVWVTADADLQAMGRRYGQRPGVEDVIFDAR